MAAGIAHEVRNPLGSIGLYARMLQQDLADRPEQQDVARKIAGAVTRLNSVVGDVLAFAKEIKLRPTRVDAGTLLEEALSAARADSAEWHGVTVKSPDLPGPEIDCDPALLHRALLNVIRNAVEAMADLPPGSLRVLTLDARPHAHRRPAGPAQSMIALSIRDTGPGIPPEVRERMFNPFFTTRATGTGLGLAIVHRIVDAHGGRTAVRNPRGGGAIVELLLPVFPA
jgi:signal transduction histidine kinase